MKKQFFLVVLLIAGFNYAQAQVCLKPTPMTAEQVQKVIGKWKGTYTNSAGEKTEMEISISVNDKNIVTCDINNPPLAGKETDGEYFFCPGGEFHLRKFVDDVSYVLQGTPQNNQIKGLVSVYDNKNKRTLAGNFAINKAQ
jgi:hypothetical protein